MDTSYPIGPIPATQARDEATLRQYARDLERGARDLHELLGGLRGPDWELTYRAGSFTVRQLAHHLADAHEQGFARFRWGLCDHRPPILPMNQEAWARLADYQLDPQVSLALFDAVNARWVAVLDSLAPDALDREVLHPQEGPHDLWRLLAKHEWHVRHHLAHARLALGSRATTA